LSAELLKFQALKLFLYRYSPLGTVSWATGSWGDCWSVIAHTLLNTAHTVGLRWGASLSAGCGYNPGCCRSHPTISEMT